MVVLALLLAVPVVAQAGTGGPPSTTHSADPSSGVARATAGACGRAAACTGDRVRPSSATPSGAPTYQANHTLAWSTAASPPPDFGLGGGLVANSSSGVAVAFGGVSSGVLVNSTFAYSEMTNSWSTVPLSRAPTPRTDFAFDFDPATGTAVLFGGLTNLTTLAVSNETWTYSDGSARWSQLPGGVAPPAREGAAFAIVPPLGVGLLYGGWNRNYSKIGSLTYSDLWELNLSTGAWSNLTASGTRPPPLEGAAMLWDPTTGRIEMFGGCYPCSSEVWQLDPVTLEWTALVAPPSAPAARGAASWAYAPTLHADLLFGGADGGMTYGDTQVFFPGNNTWVEQTLGPGPAARANAASAFLDVPGNETWLLPAAPTGGTTNPELWRLSATANLTVEVVNASSLAPLRGAAVNMSSQRVGTTGSAGLVNLTQVDVTGVALNVTDVPWFFPANRTLWLAPGVASSLTVELTPEPLGSVLALVLTTLNPPFPTTFSNLTVDSVRINSAPVVTNASGWFANFYGVPPGFVNVTTQGPGWRPAFVNGTLAPGSTLNLTVTMYPEPLFTVTVLGRLPVGTLLPLDLAAVFINGTEIGVTDAQGVLTVTTAALGLQPVKSQVFGFFESIAYVLFPYTGSVTATLVLPTQPFGLLAVTVLRANDSLPIADASILAQTTVALAFGSYELANFTDDLGTASLSLPEGTYELSATAVNYEPSPLLIVNISSGVNAPITIRLHPVPPATAHVLVRDGTSKAPIDGANLTVLPVLLKGHSNAEGFYNATNLTPGTYTFVVSASGYIPNSTTLTLESGDNRTLTVNLTRATEFAVSGPGWGFNLFPGGSGDLWPFLLLPLVLIVGSFVFASMLRGVREEEGPTPAPETTDPASAGPGEQSAGSTAPSSKSPP